MPLPSSQEGATGEDEAQDDQGQDEKGRKTRILKISSAYNTFDDLVDEEEEEADGQATWTIYNEWDIDALLHVREDEDEVEGVIVSWNVIAYPASID